MTRKEARRKACCEKCGWTPILQPPDFTIGVWVCSECCDAHELKPDGSPSTPRGRRSFRSELDVPCPLH
jgi:ribosomal protein L37AE/L43A